MSFEINKVYTENPYVDEMVYYTKKLGMETVLKLKDLADNSETVESLRNGDLYISCIEGTAILEIFPKITKSALKAAGIIDPVNVELCINNRENIPMNKRDAVTKALVAEYIENYEELNPYYRMLHGLPAVGKSDYVEDWVPPDGIAIDISKPIHEMTNAEALILDRYGVLDSMMEEDPVNRQYMRHLGKKAIDYYTARRANRFDPLYIPTIDSDAIQKMYKDKLDANKFYVLRTVYSEAYKYDSDYYDNFIAVFIVLITMIDIISRVQEFVARKEIFDIRSVQYIFKSYGVPFFEEIPLKYQISMVKNLHTLLKYKSTAKCMVDICSLFGFNNIKIFKYYLLRDRKVDLTTGEYVEAFDENGNEDFEKEYELKFLKLPLEDELNDYIQVGGNYVDYDEITTGDATWDGGLDHNEIMKAVLEQEFNFTRTKYISIDTIYDIAKMSAQQSYFFNFLYDNVPLESMITIQVPYIESGKDFKIADIFTLLTVLTYYYNGVKDTIMDTTGKVLYVNGFNFKADLATLAAEISPKKINDVVVDPGSTLHAREQLDKFIIPEASIPSFNEMMNIFVNNMDVRDELIKGMQESDNKRVLDVYKKLYDALMTVQLTMDYYKNPETGDFYRDEEGDATYTEFLKHRDASLYYAVLQTQEFEDDASRNQYIANLIDSIVYALEEYIDSDEFQYLFSNLPVMSSEAVKQYIATVINFYKSYKVDFLGLNTIYTFDDKKDGAIRLIDDMLFHRFFQRNEFIKLYDEFAKNFVTMSSDEKIKLIERIYLDIRTWSIQNKEDRITLKDEIWEKITKLVLHTIIQCTEEIYGINTEFAVYDTIISSDYLSSHIHISSKDELGIIDRLWIINNDASEEDDPYMNLVDPSAVGSIITADAKGNSSAPMVYISNNVKNGKLNVVTEKAVEDYVKEVALPKTDIITKCNNTVLSNCSDTKTLSEKCILEALSFHTFKVKEDTQ